MKVGPLKGWGMNTACRFCYVSHLFANGALPLSRQGREHDNDGVVPGRVLNEFAELVPVQANDRPLGAEIEKLLNFVAEDIRLLGGLGAIGSLWKCH